MKMKNIAIAIIASMAFAGVANAAKSGAYIGGGLGYSSLDNFTDTTKRGSGGAAGTIFVGYNFDRFLGIEAAYRSYAKTSYALDAASYITLDYAMHAFTLVGKGYLPFSETSPFNIYALLGMSEVYGTGEFERDGTNIAISSSNNALLGTAGLGFSYDITSHITTSCEYSVTGGKTGDDDHIGIPRSNLVTLNLAYNFG